MPSAAFEVAREKREEGRQMRTIILNIMMLALALSCSRFEYATTEKFAASCYLQALPYDTTAVTTVMATRLVDAVHYVWEADTVPVALRPGEYYATAFQYDESVYSIDGLDDFRQRLDVSMLDVYASLPILPMDDQASLPDYNWYSFFLAPAQGPLKCGFQRLSLKDSLQNAYFPMRPLTQKLKFRLRLLPEEGVSIDSLSAAVSGVARRVRLMTGLIRNDADNPTYRQYVPLSLISQDREYQYEGQAEVLGLFPPAESVYTAGPGIFQVRICAAVQDEGRTYARVFHAGINMKSIIEAAGLMEEAADRTGYRIVAREALLEIPVVLNVRKDRVISGDGGGLESWFVSDADIEVEI